MHRIRFTLFTLLALACSVGLAAQARRDSLPAARWELGADLLALFEKNNVPANSLFVRYNYRAGPTTGRAWRLRVGLDIAARDAHTTFEGLKTSHYKTYTPILFLGHEWQWRARNYRWYVGAEASGQYTFADEFFVRDALGTLVTTVDYHTVNVGMSGLVGFQQNLTRNLAIAVEAAFSGHDRHYKSRSLDTAGSSIWAWGGDIERTWSTVLKPFMVINLIYQLKKQKSQ